MISTYVPYLAKHVVGGQVTHLIPDHLLRLVSLAPMRVFFSSYARICWFFLSCPSPPCPITSRHLKRKTRLETHRFDVKYRFWKRNKYLGPFCRKPEGFQTHVFKNDHFGPFWTIWEGWERFGEVSAGEFELDFLEILMFFMIDRLCVFWSFYNLLSHFVVQFVKSLFLEIIGMTVFVFSYIIWCFCRFWCFYIFLMFCDQYFYVSFCAIIWRLFHYWIYWILFVSRVFGIPIEIALINHHLCINCIMYSIIELDLKRQTRILLSIMQFAVATGLSYFIYACELLTVHPSA